MGRRQIIAPTPERGKVQALEGLRALMAWWVVFGHLSHTLGLNLPLIDNNTLAVDVFVILSGYVIFRLIDVKQEAYGPYLVRRMFRIFPLYLSVLLVSTILLPVYARALADIPFHTARNVERLTQTIEAIRALPTHLLFHIPLLQGLVPTYIIPDVAYTIVGQAWSISLELQYYLVAPLIFLSISRPRLLPLVVIAVIALLLVRGMTDAFLGHKILLFGIGITSHLAVHHVRQPEQRLALIVLIGLGIGVIIQRPASVIPVAIWAVAFASTRYDNHRLPRAIQRVLIARPLVFLGERSYSIYMVHMIPLYLGVFLLNQLAISHFEYGLLLILFTSALTLGVSMVTFLLIEKPGIMLGARLAGR